MKNTDNYIGRVVRILSDTTLIIDAGYNDVSAGDKIQIFEISDNILGIEGEDLGPLIYVKAELRVIQTEEAYSICETPTYKVSSSIDFSDLFMQNEKTEEHYKLNVNPKDILPMKPISDAIRIGDFAKLVKYN